MKAEQGRNGSARRITASLSAAALVAGMVFSACGGSGDDSSDGGADNGDKGGTGSGAEAGQSTTGGSSPGTGGSIGLGGTGGDAGGPGPGGNDTGGTSTGGTSTGGSSTGGQGATGPDVCAPAGADCDSGPDCCSFSCVGGECSDDQCIADGEECSANEECCGGTCTNGSCAPLNGACRTSGNPCSAASECCSKYCVDDVCSPAPSYCRQLGDACRAHQECCGGFCTIASGATLGTCALAPATGATGCLSAGEVCSDGATYNPEEPLPTCGGECCSRACFPYGPTGVLVCQPPSGCHPTGETCTQNLDCCGAEGRPDGDPVNTQCQKEDPSQPIGRCDNGNVCSPAGGICRLETVQCNATATCCAGNVMQNPMVCRQDNLGIPRCLAADIDCTDPSDFVGDACASSADCCNLPCVPNPDGDPPFICAGDDCVPAGGSCTNTADCCRGLPCVIAPGSTMGVCGDDTGTGGTGGMGGTGGTGGTDAGGTSAGGTNTGGMPTGGTGGVCSAWGQGCEITADCCNGVPCNGGVCMDEPR